MTHHTSSSDPIDMFPSHLRDYAALVEHIDSLLEGKSPSEKGDRFARFVARFLPQSELGLVFATPELRPVKTHDKGVDLVAQGRDGSSVLYIQAKKRVDSAQDIRDVIDGFHEFITTSTNEAGAIQYKLVDDEQTVYHCLLFTLSRLKRILESYENRPSSTKELYEQLVREGRMHFIDGDDILGVLQAAYRKFSGSPYRLVLNLEVEVSQKDNVFVGIISSEELKRLYREFDDALFFENVRDFLGVEAPKQKGRTTPNQDIVKTVQGEPERMLGRNNGIVIRADEIRFGESTRQLILTRGGVVNGCQTTRCIVEYAQQPCYVPVKVVQTDSDEAWNITKAANYQTEVPDIDLNIARSLRPQLLRRYGFISGVEVEHGQKSALQLLDDLYDNRVTYNETRLLYIGLFSRTPNNLIAGNYTELEGQLIDRFSQDDPFGAEVFQVLLALQKLAREGRDRVQSVFGDVELFSRYYEPDTPIYRCFVSILALCGAVGMDITERVLITSKAGRRGEGRLAIGDEYERMRHFLHLAEQLLDENPQVFLDYYVAAFNVWMREMGAVGEDDAVARQAMYTRTKNLRNTAKLAIGLT